MTECKKPYAGSIDGEIRAGDLPNQLIVPAGVDVVKTDMAVGVLEECRDDRGQDKFSCRHSLGKARVTGPQLKGVCKLIAQAREKETKQRPGGAW